MVEGIGAQNQSQGVVRVLIQILDEIMLSCYYPRAERTWENRALVILLLVLWRSCC